VNIEAVTSAIDRRNGLMKELSNMHTEIEETSLKFKKEPNVKISKIYEFVHNLF